jgi:hypothetical protein
LEWPEITALIMRKKHSEPPEVDELLIATTGQFAADAVALIEKGYHEREVPLVTM